MTDDIAPLATTSIRARRRPGAIAGLWAWQTVLAVLASWPAVALVRAAYGGAPSGDAALWEPGALPLLALLSREAAGVRAATGAASAVLVVAAVAGLVPLAAVMFSMANATRSGRGVDVASAVAFGVRVFRPFGLLLVVATVAQGAAAAAAILFGELVAAWTHKSLGEAHAQELGIVVGATLGTVVVVFGVMHDLARSAVVRLGAGPVHALIAAGQLLRAAPLTLVWSWAWRTLASLAPLVAVAAVADRLGGRGGAQLLVLAALHQLVIVARVALRASWLAKALRTVDEATHRPFSLVESARD